MTRFVKLIRFLPYILGLLLIIMLAYYIMMFGSADEDITRKKVEREITVFIPPPPPPPEQQQQPEEEILEAMQEEAAFEDMDDAMPDEDMGEDIGSDLGIDAEGTAGGDGFGLLARKGGRGLVGGGGGGYGALVVQEINAMLVDDERLRRKEYTVILQLWINEIGTIERYVIDKRETDSEVITMLDSALARMGSISSGPPLALPQPIRLRIKSRL